MSKRSIPLRKYQVGDDDMFAYARVRLMMFHDDRSDFESFDPSFDAQYETDWQAAIEAAEKEMPDEQRVDVQEGKTKESLDQLQACREKYGEVKFYVLKAFPDSYGVQQQFGLGNYHKVRKSKLKMFSFMNVLHEVAEEHKTELFSKGYTQPKIDEIASLAQALLNSDIDQSAFKKDEVIDTEARINLHNEVYEYRTRVAAASRFVYPNDYAKRKKYLLPHRARKKKEEE